MNTIKKLRRRADSINLLSIDIGDDVGFTLVTFSDCGWGTMASGSLTRSETSGKRSERSDQALRRSEALLARAQQIANLGSWEWDVASGEVFWSDQVYKLFGKTPGSFQPSYEVFLNSIAVEDRERVRNATRLVLTGQPYRVEYRVPQSDGSFRHMVSQADVDFDESRNPVRVIGVVQDITERKQAEAVRQRYELLAQHSRDIILFLECETGHIIEANEAAVRAYSYSRQELQRLTIQQLRAPEARQLTSQQMAEADRHGIVFETIHRRSDGTVFPVEVSSQGAMIGETRCLVSVVRDITQRKQTELALRKSEERLRFHVENTPLAVIEWGPDFRIMHWSGEAEKLFGWGAEEVIGKFQTDFRWIYDEDREVVERTATGLVTGNTPRSVSCNRNYRKDGSVVHCEWYNSSRLDESGKLNSILSLVLDVTEKKRLEEELRRRAEEVEKLMDVAPVAIWVADDPECRHIRGNRMANRMYDADTGENVSTSQPIHEQRMHRRFFRDGRELRTDELPMQYAAAHNVDVEGELEVFLPSGRALTMYGYSSPLRGADGNVRGCVAVFIDITSRKQAEQALIRSEKLASVGRMAATIAHEINNPLAAVMNTLYLAKATLESPGLVGQYLEIADAELKRIAHITRQALGFYRDSTGPTVTDVREIIGSVLDLLKSKTNSKRVHMVVDCNNATPLKAAAGEIRQVISNIIANALDAIEVGGTIRVRVSRLTDVSEEPLVRITIADNGVGVDPALRAKIFEPFFTTKRAVGTGLGLWICRQIIEKHQGTIRVRSKTRGDGRGTTFCITLPGEAQNHSEEAAAQG